MWQIKFGEHLIYDPRGCNDIDRLYVYNVDADFEVGTAERIAVSIPAENPNLQYLTRMHGVFEMSEGGKVKCRGRINRDSSDFYKSRHIEVEGALAYLNDSVVPPYKFPDDYTNNSAYKTAAQSGNVIKFWLQQLLNNHNANTGPEQQIKLGNITVADPNNYITREDSDYSTTLEVIKNKLVDMLGGFLLMRYEPDGNYLDYLASLTDTSAQSVEYGKNLLELSTEVYSGDLYTAILPLGKDGLTISSLPNGTIAGNLIKSGNIIYDSAAVNTYGRITRVVQWDDVTVAANLRTKAASELSEVGLTMPETIECTALDLHTQDTIPSLEIGQLVRAHSAPHGIEKLYPITKLQPDIFNPGNTKITLGATTRTLTSDIAALANAASAQIRISNAQLVALVESASSTASSAQSAANNAVVELQTAQLSIAELNNLLQTLSQRVTDLENNQQP